VRRRFVLTLIGCAVFTALAPAQRVRPGQRVLNVIPDAARPLPLNAVRLTGGPLKHAQNLNAEYLLTLEPDRMLALYRKRAGLDPRAEPYGTTCRESA
jgi:hypothetical protein